MVWWKPSWWPGKADKGALHFVRCGDVHAEMCGLLLGQFVQLDTECVEV